MYYHSKVTVFHKYQIQLIDNKVHFLVFGLVSLLSEGLSKFLPRKVSSRRHSNPQPVTIMPVTTQKAKVFCVRGEKTERGKKRKKGFVRAQG